ncbi:MAG TPA: GtrA family protein [Candidatus Saccharimonadales bacterium]|nr:GtrA family protein [Candidatus Saccharimonadales bacterium]
MRKIKKPTKKGVVQFVFFNAGGAAFFIVGYAVFALLYGVLHWPWLPAKIVGDSCGWVSNFAIQFFIAFREERHRQPHVVVGKFTIISLVNLAIDYFIVWALKVAGVSPFIGMIVASQFFTVWKWFWYKRWVFAGKTEYHD